jgi:hypothetical protein
VYLTLFREFLFVGCTGCAGGNQVELCLAKHSATALALKSSLYPCDLLWNYCGMILG